jgi:hypothetical protein
MPTHVRTIYSFAVALAALGAVLYFTKADTTTCVNSYVPAGAATWPNPDFGWHKYGGRMAFAAKACTSAGEMTTTRVWGMSLAAFAVVLFASTWWLNDSASALRNFEEDSD